MKHHRPPEQLKKSSMKVRRGQLNPWREGRGGRCNFLILFHPVVQERWQQDSLNKKRSFTNIYVTSLMLSFISVLFDSQKQSREKRPIDSKSRAWIRREGGVCKRVLMKTLECAFLYAYVCLLRASEWVVSLEVAHRRPSTPRLHGIAIKRHKTDYYSS